MALAKGGMEWARAANTDAMVRVRMEALIPAPRRAQPVVRTQEDLAGREVVPAPAG